MFSSLSLKTFVVKSFNKTLGIEQLLKIVENREMSSNKNNDMKQKRKNIAETRDYSELMWVLRFLNQGPSDLQSDALPTELSRQPRDVVKK